jgi:hypothetical protein
VMNGLRRAWHQAASVADSYRQVVVQHVVPVPVDLYGGSIIWRT